MKFRNIVNLFLISCSILFAGLTLSLISPFYPSEALAKGVSVTQSGLVMATVFATLIIFTPVCGKYMKVFGAKKFLIAGSFIVGLGNFFFGFLSQLEDKNTFFGLSILIRFFIALGQAASSPAAYTLAGKQVQEKHRGKAISMAEACFGIGTMVGPTVGGGLYDMGGFSLPFWVSGSVMVFMAAIAMLFFKDSRESVTVIEEENNVSWLTLFKAPGILISLFTVLFAGIAWSWYSASLEPFMSEAFSSSASEVGLVYLVFGVIYTVFTPVFGYLTDRGLDGLLTCIIGNSLIALAFIFLGPVPPLAFIKSASWMIFLSLGIQGLGSAATYIGALLYMMKSARDAGIPETEQTNGMVSSLWVVADCVGGVAGSALGGVAFDTIGFEWGSMAMFLSIMVNVIVLIIYLVRKKIVASAQNNDNVDSEETPALLKQETL